MMRRVKLQYRSGLALTVLLSMIVSTRSALAGGGGVNAHLVGQWDGFALTYADVWADGETAYLGHFGHPAINILDISDPTAPTAIEYALPNQHQSASAQDVKVGDGMLFIGLEGNSNAAVHIVDVRDPSDPQAVVDIDLPRFNLTHNVFYADGFLYIADSQQNAFAVVDLRNLDPDNPPKQPITEAMWVVEDVGVSKVHDITVQHGRVYAAAWDSGLWVYDVSNVANEPPSLLGNTPDGGDNTHSAWATANGDYVVTGEERTGGGIKVYRITDNGDSLDLELTDSMELPVNLASSVHNQVIVGYRLFNSWYGAGMQVLDIDPKTGLLEFVASYDAGGSVWGIYPCLGEDRIVLSDMVEGLLIVALDVEVLGDLDGDGTVGTVDLLQLLGAWGPCGDCGDCPADLDDDCTVGATDLIILLGNWG